MRYICSTMANELKSETKAQIVSLLCEGNSIRSIERITGVHRDNVMRLGVRIGTACAKIQDEKMRSLNCAQIEVDEIWGFIGAKRKIAAASERMAMFGRSLLWMPIPS